MPTFAERFETVFRKTLPSPLAIALILTFIAFGVALFSTCPADTSYAAYAVNLLGIWQTGMWQSSLLAFTVQMMLILVLGHALALSPPISRFIDKLCGRIKSGNQAAVTVGVLTMLVAFFNWGLGLIFGAIFARKVAEMAHRNNIPISYPLIGAAGYSGLMIWHGGISGSAPLKANETGHITEMAPNAANVPDHVSLSDTIFSSMNAYATLAILLTVALTLWLLSKYVPTSIPKAFTKNVQLSEEAGPAIGAEKLDQKKGMAYFWGALIIGWSVYSALTCHCGLSFITPNFINFILLGAIFIAHGTLSKAMNAFEEAISGAAGILIQFPLYFGIMALVRDSGLILSITNELIAHSNETSFPITTLLSAGIINVFVPSGGGQWAIQGPILIEASQALNVSLGKSIMALSYGDQLTNMLQPFWALPLLGITKLKAREILPYTLILMVIGFIVYTSALLLF